MKITFCEERFPKTDKILLYLIHLMPFLPLKHLKTPQICPFQHVWCTYKKDGETRIPEKNKQGVKIKTGGPSKFPKIKRSPPVYSGP